MNEALRLKLLNALTEYDRKQSTKKHYNRYALGHYCRALESIAFHVKRGEPLRHAILSFTNGKIAELLCKAASVPAPTDDEASFYPSTLEYIEDLRDKATGEALTRLKAYATLPSPAVAERIAEELWASEPAQSLFDGVKHYTSCIGKAYQTELLDA